MAEDHPFAAPPAPQQPASYPSTPQALSPLLGLVVNEFNVTLGPRTLFAAPDDVLPYASFARIKEFLVPKAELYAKIVDIAVPDHNLRVVGYAVNLEGERYPRNYLLFNVSMVFTLRGDTAPYYPLLRKIAHFLTALEEESAFVSRHMSMVEVEDDADRGGLAAASVPETEPLRALLHSIFSQLQTHRAVNITMDDHNALFLSLDDSVRSEGLSLSVDVHLWDVPLLVAELPPRGALDEWGLAILAILPFIDGFNHVKRIAGLTGMTDDLACRAISLLADAGYVALVDVFQFSNVYHTTPKLDDLYEPDAPLMASALRVLAPPGAAPPSPKTVLDLYSAIQAPRTLAQFCLDHDLDALCVDVVALVRFGVLHGILRRVHKFVVALENTAHDDGPKPSGPLPSVVAVTSPVKKPHPPTAAAVASASTSLAARAAAMADGTHSWDQMCTLLGVSGETLDGIFTADTSFLTFLR